MYNMLLLEHSYCGQHGINLNFALILNLNPVSCKILYCPWTMDGVTYNNNTYHAPYMQQHNARCHNIVR